VPKSEILLVCRLAQSDVVPEDLSVPDAIQPEESQMLTWPESLTRGDRVRATSSLPGADLKPPDTNLLTEPAKDESENLTDTTDLR
jgi:hypothetical protein